MSFGSNDYRDYLIHTSKGTKWKNHKYLYKDQNGRYIYPEDVRNSSNNSSSNSFGGSGRKFNTVAKSLSGRSLADKATSKRKTNKYMKSVLNNATEAAKKRAHGGGKSTTRTNERYQYTWGQLVNPSDYGITRVDTVRETYGGSGRKLSGGSGKKSKTTNYSAEALKNKYANDFKTKVREENARLRKKQKSTSTKKNSGKDIAKKALALLTSGSTVGRIATTSSKLSSEAKKSKSSKQASRASR